MTPTHEESRAVEEADIDRPLLLSLVETVIPARPGGDAMPAASALAEFRDLSSGEAELIYGPVLRLLSGPSAVEGAEGFASLDRSARESILRKLQSDFPELVRGAVVQTAIRYYGSEAVSRALGLEARPPHPQGYALGETNWALLEPVREMDPIYKTAPEKGEET